MISFGRHICNDFNAAIEKEWIITNKMGSYSSSTILMSNTRKHHGLLVAKYPGIDTRIVIFPNCDEDVEIAGNIYSISTHKYKETIYPKGYSHLENFTLKDDMVTFLFLIDNVRLKKEIYLMKDTNTIVITYTVLTPNSFVKLHVKPFIAFRETETVLREINIFEANAEVISQEKIKIQPYKNVPPAYIYNPDKSEFTLNGVWYRDFTYLREAQSGFDSVEDLYNVGIFNMEIEYNKPKSIIFSTDDMENVSAEKLHAKYKTQMKQVKDLCHEVGACMRDDDYSTNIQQLIFAAESFAIKDNEDKPMVLTGYPYPNYIWFRDTFAAMPGLYLVLKKFDEAKSILIDSLKYEKNGLLPFIMTMNKNDIKYTSVDTTLWFFYALYKYLEYTKDYALVDKNGDFFKRLTWIIQKHVEGTDYNIHMDDDGLLYAGYQGLQLTWMDTKVGGTTPTARQGKAVEVNALWYNAIKIMEYITIHNNETEMANGYKEMAEKIYKSFNEKFWNEEDGSLYDCLENGNKDASIRPNQIMAISLPFVLIDDADKKEMIMNSIIKELYTSFGLRTLSNMNNNFKARYDGNQATRDAAAHQGTVWAWTIGHFVTAYLKTFGKGKDSLAFIETVYEPIFEHLKTAGLGTVSEMFDGNFPYNARGRTSHAWAVAELLRSYLEDYLDLNAKD
ncbi:MAG: amylo-alpha-1,6-glucosidase [bacterium]